MNRSECRDSRSFRCFYNLSIDLMVSGVTRCDSEWWLVESFAETLGVARSGTSADTRSSTSASRAAAEARLVIRSPLALFEARIA